MCQQARHDDKELCLINLDETSIHRCALRSKGYVTKKNTNLGRPPARFINRSLKRGTATHVAAISHLPEIQALLPQFVLLNKRTFREKDIPDKLTSGLRFIRDISGWNTAQKMVFILENIAKSLISSTKNHQIIILLDVAPCHIDELVISTANRLNLWLIFVPARMTFMLQPLDVSCLQAYKSVLNQQFMERQDKDGTLRTKEWFNVLSGLNKFFWRGRNWKTAFHNVGLLGKPKWMSEELRQLGVTRLKDTLTPLPSESQLQEIWPRRRTIPYKSLFWLPAKLKPAELD